MLSLGGNSVGTFGGMGRFRDAVPAAYLLPLTFREIAAIFREATPADPWPPLPAPFEGARHANEREASL